jgi:hypothetical protein
MPSEIISSAIKSGDVMFGDVAQVPPLSEEQQLILRATHGPAEAAAAAWQSWREQFDLDSCEPAVFALLPGLYRSLEARGVVDPLIPRLKGIYRRTWTGNQLWLARASALVGRLEAGGVRTLLPGDPALALRYHGGAGARHLEELEIQVRPSEAHRALGVIGGAGWRPAGAPPAGRLAAEITVGSGVDLVNARHGRARLSWHTLPRHRSPAADDEYWARSVPLNIPGVATRALEPDDQLLWLCARFEATRPVSFAQTISDAAAVLLNSPDASWERLAAQARDRRLLISLGDLLSHVETSLAHPRLAKARVQAAGSRVSKAELAERDDDQLARSCPGARARLLLHVRRFAREVRPTRPWAHPRPLLHFLQLNWGLDDPAMVPAHALVSLLGKLRPIRGTQRPSI